MTKRARKAQQIPLHGPEAFAAMRKAGQAAAEVIDYLIPFVQPGITTQRIDDLLVAWTAERGYVNGPLNYHGFTRSLCTSVNHVVCHGIPGDQVLKEGDIVNLDVTPVVGGWYGDSSRMTVAGKPSAKAQRLMDAAYDCMMLGIETIRPGATLGDLGHAIQSHAESKGYSIVRDFCGHGIGQDFHAEPSVLHYGRPGRGTVLEEGMIFTVEPMLNAGRAEVGVLDDGWTAVTLDGSLSAQFEHTVGVTADGVEIFTLSPKGLHRPPYQV